MKAAIVKEDGLIYVNEVPEEPKFGNPLYEGVRTELIRRDYQRKLASAMDSSIFVSDQEKASKIIIAEWMRLGGSPVDGILPGIYPIPDLQWEVKEELYMDNAFRSRKVAILKESTPSTEREPKRVLVSASAVENPILSSLDSDANLYDLNEKYMDFLLWFYKSQFGYQINDHAMRSIIEDMREYQKVKP